MESIDYARIVLMLLFLGVSHGIARADGGVIRLRESQGPLVVTVFTPGDMVQDRTADVSILVQNRSSGEAVLDASVNLAFSAPAQAAAVDAVRNEQFCGVVGSGHFAQTSEVKTTQIILRASRKFASNKLLYAAPVKFDNPGNWRLEVSIQRGTETAQVACDVPVGSAGRGALGLIPSIMLPFVMVGLFAVNQSIRKKTRILQVEQENQVGVPGSLDRR